jgi:hypothetical protein
VDAVVLDNLPDSFRVEDVLANGIAIAVRGHERPDPRWPWRHVNGYWVLDGSPLGSDSAIGGEIAYLPAESWRPGQPAALRRQIVLVGVVVALVLLLGALLVRGRAAILAGALVVFASALAIEDGNTIPVLLDARHALRIDLRLRCPPDGTMFWQFRLTPQMRAAFRSRRVAPGQVVPAAVPSTRSPLRELVRQMYLRPGWEIAGEVIPGEQDEGAWAGVLVAGKSLVP